MIHDAAINAVTGAQHQTSRELCQVEDQLGALESQAALDPAVKLALQDARIKYAELLEQLQIIDNRSYTQRIHMEAHRPGALLARIIRDAPPPTPIVEIITPLNGRVTSKVDISDTFYGHYQALYRAPQRADPLEFHSFLSKVRLPRITNDAKKTLVRPITTGEIHAAIKSLPNNKTPDLDGLPAEFYAGYAQQLTPHLKKLYMANYDTGTLPSSIAQALITSLPKPGRDPSTLNAYRPLSLLNTEYKILSKILVAQLKPLLTGLIHVDQC